MEAQTSTSATTSERIVDATIRLLDSGGADAVSTRAVSAAAGVQAPTIYRLFGDKQGLLDAVAIHGLQRHLETKALPETTADPVDDLRAGWDLHVGFGLANPALYALMFGEHRPGASSPAALAAHEALAAVVHRVAQDGRLRIPEGRASNLLQAAGSGTTLTLIAMPEEERDLELSVVAREAIIAAITTDAPVASQRGPVGAAIALGALLPETSPLTGPERSLLGEWLARIAAAADSPGEQEREAPAE